MTVWFTADTHFRHRNIMILDHRPFKSLEEHDEELVKRWNEKVKPGDTVYHLGDFCFSGIGRSVEFKDRLNGNIILIKGNHDGGMTRMRKVFPDVHKTLVIEFHGRKVRLSHRPRRDWAEYERKVEEGMAPPNDGLWLLHGHTHLGGRKVHERQINVNVIFWDYYPVSEFEILSIMEMEENLPKWRQLIRRLYGQIKWFAKMRWLFKELPQRQAPHIQERAVLPSRRERRLLRRLLEQIQTRIREKGRRPT